ncbi:MAG TPA: hypothetical protein DHV62_02670 [Elusimicrobia bacterium]|jgi:mRNA-degrading endonuclease RelE of RelBE toxin-antitoxin system|nr:hypothetical protein [Elusimicrobiota bacterium]
MRFEFKPSFDRSLKHLDSQRKDKIKEAVSKSIDFFETKIKPKGLGLKNLKGDYWEIRVTIKERVIFRFRGEVIEFIIAGTHDEIKKFLKRI